jgi:hypothetical protein
MSTRRTEDELPSEEENQLPLTEVEEEDVTVERLESLEPTGGMTDDAMEAAEEGIPYRAPSDPAVLPSDDLEGLEVAAGFAPSMEETYPDSEELPERVERGDLEIQDHVYTMLRDNSETGDLNDIEVLVSRGIVLLRGSVPTELDVAIVDDIVTDLDGVRAVRNELRVEG